MLHTIAYIRFHVEIWFVCPSIRVPKSVLSVSFRAKVNKPSSRDAVMGDADDPTPMAVSVPMPAQRFHGREDDLAQALLAACAQIRREFGVE